MTHSYERASLEAHDKFDSLPRVDVSQPQPTYTEACKQLLESLPSSLLENSQRDSLAALATSRDHSVSSLEELPPSSRLSTPSYLANPNSPLFRSDLRNLKVELTAIALLILVVGWVAFVVPPRSSSPNHQPSPQPNLSTKDDFLRSQNLTAQKPFATKQLAGIPTNQIGYAIFSGDVKRLAVSEIGKRRLHIFEVPSLRPICILKNGGNGTRARFSSDGSLLLLRNNKGLELWSAQTGKRKFAWTLAKEDASNKYTFDLSPDRKYVIGVAPSSAATIWSARTGKQLFEFESDSSPLFLGFTQDSKQWVSVSAFGDGKILQRRDIKTRVISSEIRFGGESNSQDLSEAAVKALTFQTLADNRFIVNLSEERALLFDFNTPQPPKSLSLSYNFGIYVDNSWPPHWSPKANVVLRVGVFNDTTPPEFILFLSKYDLRSSQFASWAVLNLTSGSLPRDNAFSPDNKLLYVLDNKGKLSTWKLDKLKWS